MRVGKYCLIAIIIAFLGPAQLLAGSQSSASFRLRAAAMYGPAQFSSQSYVTNTKADVGGSQPGLSLDAESWFSSRVGVAFSGSLFTANVEGAAGKFINQAYTGIDAGVRVLDGGASGPELALFAGPGVDYFSDVRVYPAQSFYDTNRINLFGFDFGARFRVALSRVVALELSAMYFAPSSILGNAAAKYQTGHSFRSALWLDFPLGYSIEVGAGLRFDRNVLEFTPSDSARPETIKFDVTTPAVSIKFSL